MELKVIRNKAFKGLWSPARYKIYYGGRGSGKSWEFARTLVIRAFGHKLRILCAREYQNSIQDSVKKLLDEQIEALGLAPWHTVQDTMITNHIGSEFIFKGLARNIQGIKSTEGVDICWVEEAQTISEASLRILTPTIRKPGSELWFSYNPDQESDPMHKLMLSLRGDPDAVVRKVGWQDNPWFPDELDRDRRRLLASDQDAYDHVWEGECLRISEAVIFRHRVEVREFEAPENARFHFGADWGFAQDPTFVTRCYMQGEDLFIDYEAVGRAVEMDGLPALFESIPGSRLWPIKADSARPETISFMANKYGFKISAADKWKGSVEDGVERLKAFRRIVVHPRCTHLAKEFRMYSYKVDKLTGDILPVIVDAWNHGIDSLRYGLDGIIQNRRGGPVFSADTMAALRRVGRAR